jgi:hypothetical protein
LRRLLSFVPTDSEHAKRACEDAASCLSSIATGYTWADEFMISERLLEGALRLAQGTLTALNIERELLEIFQQLCRMVYRECAEAISRGPGAGHRNRVACDRALNRFDSEVQPALNRLLRLLPGGLGSRDAARQEAALCLCGIACCYTWADDLAASERLLERALRIAGATAGAMVIRTRLAEVRGALKRSRLERRIRVWVAACVILYFVLVVLAGLLKEC